ncbi:MAG: IS3 family transposase, partial [Candidatus Zixiibacteriota bacterium]
QKEGKGDCWDNAVMESFFATLKTELIYNEIFITRKDVKSKIFDYIELFYNRKRRHSSLGSKSPIEFEIMAKPT